MLPTNEQLIEVGLGIIYSVTIKQKRKCWLKYWLQKKNLLSHTNIIRDLRTKSDYWGNCMRMDENIVSKTVWQVTPII